MKKFFITILLSLFICIPTSFANTKIITPNFTILYDLSPQTTQIDFGKFLVNITTPDTITYFTKDIPNNNFAQEYIGIPNNPNSNNFLNQWENNIKNNVKKYDLQQIIYIEKTPIKNGIIVILSDYYGYKEVKTYYYKNGAVYGTDTYFKNLTVTLNELKTYSYKMIDSIYPL